MRNREDQWENVHNSGKPTTDVGLRGRYMGVEESTEKEIGCRRNENGMLRWMCGVTSWTR